MNKQDRRIDSDSGKKKKNWLVTRGGTIKFKKIFF